MKFQLTSCLKLLEITEGRHATALWVKMVSPEAPIGQSPKVTQR